MTRLSELNTELDRLAPALARSTDVQALINEGRRLRSENLAVMATRCFAAVGRTVRGSSLAHARRRRQTINELQALSDRMLHDIGLTRDQIVEVATLLTARPAVETRRRATVRAEPLVRSLIARARRARLRQVTIRELEQLSDRVLSDIGIPRCHIPAAVDQILKKQSAQAPAVQSGGSPVHELLLHLEGAVRPFRQWHLSRLAAGQIARFGNTTLSDLGYVKGDLDWVSEVLAKRKIANLASRPQAGAA